MHIDYQHLLDQCLIEFVRKILTKVQNEGIGESHHLYISFNTNNPEVILSPKIKQLYPNEITIILRYQFEDLKIYDDKFSVRLSFNKVPETIEVPFKALTSFVDPSVKFSLQLNHSAINSKLAENHPNKANLAPVSTFTKLEKKSKTKFNKDIIADHNIKEQVVQDGADVIKLDKFRNKKPKN